MEQILDGDTFFTRAALNQFLHHVKVVDLVETNFNELLFSTLCKYSEKCGKYTSQFETDMINVIVLSYFKPMLTKLMNNNETLKKKFITTIQQMKEKYSDNDAVQMLVMEEDNSSSNGGRAIKKRKISSE